MHSEGLWIFVVVCRSFLTAMKQLFRIGRHEGKPFQGP